MQIILLQDFFAIAVTFFDKKAIVFYLSFRLLVIIVSHFSIASNVKLRFASVSKTAFTNLRLEFNE